MCQKRPIYIQRDIRKRPTVPERPADNEHTSNTAGQTVGTPNVSKNTHMHQKRHTKETYSTKETCNKKQSTHSHDCGAKCRHAKCVPEYPYASKETYERDLPYKSDFLTIDTLVLPGTNCRQLRYAKCVKRDPYASKETYKRDLPYKSDLQFTQRRHSRANCGQLMTHKQGQISKNSFCAAPNAKSQPSRRSCTVIKRRCVALCCSAEQCVVEREQLLCSAQCKVLALAEELHREYKRALSD